MNLAELLEREGLKGDEVLAWARERGAHLIAALGVDDELLGLLGRTEVSVARVAGIPPPPPAEALESGAPEPIMEHIDTAPIDLDSYRRLLDADAAREADVEQEVDLYGDVDVDVAGHHDASVDAPADQIPPREHTEPAPLEPEREPARADDEDEEELDVDELVELDGEELEILDDDEEDDGDEQTAPRRLPTRGDTVGRQRRDAIAGAPKPNDDDIDIDID